ncbi:MAG: c-type cytochrome [Corynebacteriales bacterium]|nr:c-type cytochrome [Mycobacteriales bacterium]
MKSSVFAKMGERFRRAVVLLLALGALGGLYAAFSPTSTAKDGVNTAADEATYVREGQKLYSEGCISCHGRNAEGVTDRGPSLIGVGAAAVEFQVSTGRMPMARQEAQAQRKPPVYDSDETTQLAMYIQSLGGGPEIPNGDLREGDMSAGGVLFRTNCAACHAFSSNGGALSSGKFAPTLKETTDRQLYAAMLTGPQNMPVFGDNQLTPQEKKDIIAYVQSMKESKDPGGLGIGRTGPVPEGLVAFLVGIVACMFAALWIAGKS